MNLSIFLELRLFATVLKSYGAEKTDLNISDVVPKLRVKLQHSTVLNTNNVVLIWIFVVFKGNINTASLFCGIPEYLKD